MQKVYFVFEIIRQKHFPIITIFDNCMLPLFYLKELILENS